MVCEDVNDEEAVDDEDDDCDVDVEIDTLEGKVCCLTQQSNQLIELVLRLEEIDWVLLDWIESDSREVVDRM